MFSALTILPLSVTIIGAAFAIVILNHYVAGKRRPHELIWGVAFLLFAIGAACQVFADLSGTWTPLLARVYYLTGAILNVALLGLGTVYLLAPRRVGHLALGVMVLFALVSFYVIFMSQPDPIALAKSQQIDWKAVWVSNIAPRILAGIGSGIGSLIVIGGALWSGIIFWRKRIMKSRMIGVFLLAGGTFVVALGGTVQGFFNNDNFLYPTMALGVIMMFVGYLQTIRPAPSQQGNLAQPAPGRTPTV